MCKNLATAIKNAKKVVKAKEEGKIELDFQIRIENAQKIVDKLSRKKEIARAEEIKMCNLIAYEKAKAFLEMISEIKTENYNAVNI